jgi:osmotically-inducible protein OsmY
MKRVFFGVTVALALGVFCGCQTVEDDDRAPGERSVGETIDDTVLSQRVRAALDDSPQYKFSEVRVQSYRGTVQLSGFVVSDAQKDRAAELAKTIKGVRNVDNRISVRK